MKTISVDIKLNFSNDEEVLDCEMPKTNGVPLSMILENLNNLTKGLAKKIVKDAYGDVPEDLFEKYIDSIIATDRMLLEEMLKQ